MKLKLLIFLMLLSGVLYAQSDRRKSGILSSTAATSWDSTVTFYSAGQEWIYIFLVDSTGTADTADVRIKNLINNNWTVIGVKDQADEDFVNEMIPGVSTTGKLYVVWLLYPTNIQINKTDIHNETERLSYYIFSKGTSK